MQQFAEVENYKDASIKYTFQAMDVVLDTPQSHEQFRHEISGQSTQLHKPVGGVITDIIFARIYRPCPDYQMQRRNNQFNPKRRLLKHTEVDLAVCAELASKVSYGGNPEHKKNPGDFGLVPPSGARAGKSLCDSAQIFSRKEALAYLKQGLTKGLISDRVKGQWPQNIWSVTRDGIPLEAQLENPENGSYHGYPMPPSDPLAEEVLQRWGSAL